MFNTIETPIVVYRSAGGNELRRILIQCQAQMITDVRGGGCGGGGVLLHVAWKTFKGMCLLC